MSDPVTVALGGKAVGELVELTGHLAILGLSDGSTVHYVPVRIGGTRAIAGYEGTYAAWMQQQLDVGGTYRIEWIGRDDATGLPVATMRDAGGAPIEAGAIRDGIALIDDQVGVPTGIVTIYHRATMTAIDERAGAWGDRSQVGELLQQTEGSYQQDIHIQRGMHDMPLVTICFVLLVGGALAVEMFKPRDPVRAPDGKLAKAGWMASNMTWRPFATYLNPFRGRRSKKDDE